MGCVGGGVGMGGSEERVCWCEGGGGAGGGGRGMIKAE